MTAKTYITTKIVTAQPQSRHGQDGYQVNYPDGYTSWCPRETFHQTAIEVPEFRHLPPHLHTVMAELAQNADRLEKLKAFTSTMRFKALHHHDQYLARTQVTLMEHLGQLLLERTRLHFDPLAGSIPSVG